MRKLFKITNSKLLIIISVSITAILILLIVTSIYQKKLPVIEENYIVSITDKIYNANNKSKDFLDNSSLNLDKAIKILPSIKSELMEVASDIDSNDKSSEEKYKNSCAILSKGIFENVLVIDQLSGMLKNPTGNDLELAANNLKIFRDGADNYYSLISIDNKNFNLGTSMYAAINATIDYCISTTNTKKLDDLKKTEEAAFNTMFNEAVFSFGNIMTDFYKRVADCRDNKITYELLISDVDNSFAKVKAIKTSISSISVPDKYEGIFNDFSVILNLYNNYLYDVKYALVTEKVRIRNPKLNNDSIDTLYDSSNVSYKYLQDKYKKFVKEYNNLSSN